MKNYRFQNYSKRVPIGKIICLARTYKEHAREMNTTVTEDPLLFLKPTSSVIFNHETIVIPQLSQCLHHEVELGVIIGKSGKHIIEEKGLQHVLGYLVALDITARDLQSIAKKNGWPWAIAKGFDTFTPISDVVLKEKVLRQIEALPPNGLAEVARFIEFLQFQSRQTAVRAGKPGKRSAFGIWADYPEAQDAVAFAKKLRQRIEMRQDG